MEAKLFNQSGAEVGTIQLDDYIFGIEPNVPVMHQAMVRQQANARMGTHNTRGRGEVAGSTRKLYRQKGTGRARQGSIRAPHRKGGGIAHGPHPRSYRQAMPRKMRRLAVRSALSAKYAADEIRFVEAFSFEKPRTKDFVQSLQALQMSGKTLVVLDRKDDIVQKSAGNVAGVKTLLAHYVNVIDLLTYDNVLISRAAIDVLSSYLSQAEGDVSDDAASEEA
ncbi:MAG TPA: 50S ribosomal protein L4 [Kouleothrix sp.]|jgi:large subunit ribosomal protein L4|nr:50S ribosomal protein L4 [Kouleothrix sp.]